MLTLRTGRLCNLHTVRYGTKQNTRALGECIPPPSTCKCENPDYFFFVSSDPDHSQNLM